MAELQNASGTLAGEEAKQRGWANDNMGLKLVETLDSFVQGQHKIEVTKADQCTTHLFVEITV